MTHDVDTAPARAAELAAAVGTTLDELDTLDRTRPPAPTMPAPPSAACGDDPFLAEASEGERAAVAAAREAWQMDCARTLAEHHRAHSTSADVAAARAAWTKAGDLLAELATLDPSEETLALGSRWASLRPSGAIPSADQVRAMAPMLVAHGRIQPAHHPDAHATS